MASEVVEIEGHIIDSLTLAKVMDVILAAGADYRVLDVEIGKSNVDTSRASIEVISDSEDALASLLVELQVHGANRAHMGEAELVAADADGVLPPGFYATTNLPTRVRLGGRWLEVENPEMDCALVVRSDERDAPDATAGAPGRGSPGNDRGWRVRTVPMHRVRTGDLVVVGNDGVRVEAPERPRGATPFEFMTSEVSSEKPKGLL